VEAKVLTDAAIGGADNAILSCGIGQDTGWKRISSHVVLSLTGLNSRLNSSGLSSEIFVRYKISAPAVKRLHEQKISRTLTAVFRHQALDSLIGGMPKLIKTAKLNKDKKTARAFLFDHTFL
jgi:hypothetical protein